MFWSLVRPDRILPPITRSAAVPTSLDADESAGIVQLPGNAPQAAPGQSRGLPRGPGIEENSQGAETRARRRLEKVTQEPPGSRDGIGISASDPSHAVRQSARCERGQLPVAAINHGER